jgi:hypothetical protein
MGVQRIFLERETAKTGAGLPTCASRLLILKLIQAKKSTQFLKL